MTAIIKNIRSIWNMNGLTADACRKAVEEFRLGWLEADAYWKEHPEATPVFYHHQSGWLS